MFKLSHWWSIWSTCVQSWPGQPGHGQMMPSVDTWGEFFFGMKSTMFSSQMSEICYEVSAIFSYVVPSWMDLMDLMDLILHTAAWNGLNWCETARWPNWGRGEVRVTKDGSSIMKSQFVCFSEYSVIFCDFSPTGCRKSPDKSAPINFQRPGGLSRSRFWSPEWDLISLKAPGRHKRRWERLTS